MFNNMKVITLTVLATLALFLTATASAASGLLVSRAAQTGASTNTGTAFTYQGHLTEDGGLANGAYDLRFSLYDAEQVGLQVGSTLDIEDVLVTNGMFTASLDFGGVFDGTALWLEIAVRAGSSDGEYTSLSPRQALTAAPYTLFALDAAQIGGLSPSNIFQIGGNTVITDAVLGTSGEYGLEIRVNDQRVLGLIPNVYSPNLVGGFSTNWIGDDAYGAVIGGGGHGNSPNSVTAPFGTVGGGAGNTASGGYATVSGGNDNTASDVVATVSGGFFNTASGGYATVGGGRNNTAGGASATVSGGWHNAANGDYSFAAGSRAKANNRGCFVWADSTNDDLNCNDSNRTFFRSSGGFVIYTNASKTSGALLLSGGSSWNAFSAREYKENFAPVDAPQLLERLAAIEISTWNYKAQDPVIRHIGPMADDFNALLDDLGGEGQEYINTLDADGVALAAIQGLYEVVQQQGEEIAALEARLAALEALLAQSGAGD